MRCPKCGKNVYSHHQEINKSKTKITRLYGCRYCPCKFRTVEKIVDEREEIIKNLEWTIFEKKSKRISETYNIPSYHSDCFLVNHGDTNFICDTCLDKAKCLLIKEKEMEKE